MWNVEKISQYVWLVSAIFFIKTFSHFHQRWLLARALQPECSSPSFIGLKSSALSPLVRTNTVYHGRTNQGRRPTTFVGGASTLNRGASLCFFRVQEPKLRFFDQIWGSWAGVWGGTAPKPPRSDDPGTNATYQTKQSASACYSCTLTEISLMSSQRRKMAPAL